MTSAEFKKIMDDFAGELNAKWAEEMIKMAIKVSKEATLKEREACEKICHEITKKHTPLFDKMDTEDWLSEECAEAIRGRK